MAEGVARLIRDNSVWHYTTMDGRFICQRLAVTRWRVIDLSKMRMEICDSLWNAEQVIGDWLVPPRVTKIGPDELFGERVRHTVRSPKPRSARPKRTTARPKRRSSRRS